MARPGVVVIGTSLGGLNALRLLLSSLPTSFPLPIAIVQHRVKSADDTLVRILAACSTLPIKEPNDKDLLEPGTVYLAPADYHLLIEQGRCTLSTDGSVNYARPSIDVLFESAAETYGEGVIGVLLTGSNDDGARGCARIKEKGGRVLVEDPTTAESKIMPAAALAVTDVDQVLSLPELTAALEKLASAP